MRLTLRTPWLLVACGALGSCGGDPRPDDADTGFHSGDETDLKPPDTSDTDEDTAPTDVPTWWELDGVLVVQHQQAVQGEARFTLELRGRDLSTLCSTERSVASLTVVAPQADELYGAWEVTLADGEGCDHPVPQEFVVGVGPYDSQLDPAVAMHGIDASALFGLYAQMEGTPLYVLGVAGTEEQFAGTPAVAPPLPDGTYTLDGLHLLPL